MRTVVLDGADGEEHLEDVLVVVLNEHGNQEYAPA